MAISAGARTGSTDEPATPAPPDRRPSWTDRARALGLPHRLVLLGAFVVSRVAYALAGVSYDTSGLLFSSQLLDTRVLSDRLVESIWYLHAQPPAFNLFVGAGLRWSPLSPGTSFHLLYAAAGLVLLFLLYDLGRRLTLGPTQAVVVAIVIGCGPTVVLYENWLSYEYPVAVMLVAVVDLAARYGARPSGRLLVGITSIAALAVLTRSLMHPIWLVAVFAVVLLHRRPSARSIALASLPLVVVAGVLLKNQLLFGSPQMSSWFGYNLDKVVVQPLTNDQQFQLLGEGLGANPPPSCTVTRPDVPALAAPFKQERPPDGSDPVENFNNECVIAKYAALQARATAIAKAHPTWVAHNVAGGLEIWADPASLTPFVAANRAEIGPADEVYRRVVMLDVGWEPKIAIPYAWPVSLSAPDRRFHISLTLLLATALALSGAVLGLVRWKRRDGPSLALVVGGGTVAFVAVAGNLFELAENNRIRFVSEPLTLLLGAAVAILLVRAVRRRWSGRDRSAADDIEPPDDVEPTDDGAEPTISRPSA